MAIPAKPVGSSKFLQFCIAVWDAIWGSGRLVDSPNILIQRTTRGIALIIKSVPAAAVQSGVNYRGTYDPAKPYVKGDIVRVQIGTSQGIWICVSTTAITGVPPVFPEPASLPVPGVNQWEMFAFGIQVTAVCSSGNKIVYMNSSAPS